MDPEKIDKHDLEENDLLSFLENFKAFWKKWGNTVLFTVLLVLVVIVGRMYINRHFERKHEETWGGLALAANADAARRIAEAAGNDDLKALAYLRAGDLSFLRREQDADASGTTQPAEGGSRADRLAFAAEMYQRAVDLEASNLIKLNARLGLAAVSEELGEWDRARQHYEAVRNSAGPGNGFLSAKAEARMAVLSELQRPMTFAPAATRPATAPLGWPEQDDFPATTGPR